MANFNSDEIFEIAERIERNGAAFYKTAAENAPNADIKILLGGLYEWELSHEKTFQEMRAGLEEITSVTDLGDDAVLYLRALAGGKVFDLDSEPAKQLSGNESEDEILKIAIDLEKDSIVFYLGLRYAVAEDKVRKKIDDIIIEEMRHITVLSDPLGSST